MNQLDKNQEKIGKVRLHQLEPGMQILAVAEFSSHFKAMSPERAAWVAKQFSQCMAEVTREGCTYHCLADNLRAGDHLHRLYAFPAAFARFHRITPDLVVQLQRLGLLGFTVLQAKEQAWSPLEMAW